MLSTLYRRAEGWSLPDVAAGFSFHDHLWLTIYWDILNKTNVKAVFCSEDTAGRKHQRKLRLAFLRKSPEKVMALILLSTQYLISNRSFTNSVSGRQLKFSFKLFPLRFVIGLVVAPWSRVTASCTSATINIIIYTSPAARCTRHARCGRGDQWRRTGDCHDRITCDFIN